MVTLVSARCLEETTISARTYRCAAWRARQSISHTVYRESSFSVHRVLNCQPSRTAPAGNEYLQVCSGRRSGPTPFQSGYPGEVGLGPIPSNTGDMYPVDSLCVQIATSLTQDIKFAEYLRSTVLEKSADRKQNFHCRSSIALGPLRPSNPFSLQRKARISSASHVSFLRHHRSGQNFEAIGIRPASARLSSHLYIALQSTANFPLDLSMHCRRLKL